MSKINRGSGVLVVLRGLWRRGSVLEGRVQVRGGVRRPHGLPSRVRSARGGGFFLLRPTAPPGTIRPGILARQPCNGCGTCSLNAPFLDPRGHQRASEHVSGAERWEFPLPAHVGVRSPAPPLKVTADRSAQFRSPLTYNFIPLWWNRSTLAHI